MLRRKLAAITREEFDLRLDAYNERTRLEILQKNAELTQIEHLLHQYEVTLNEIEERLDSTEE